jgi:hypothetical protein
MRPSVFGRDLGYRGCDVGLELVGITTTSHCEVFVMLDIRKDKLNNSLP